MTTVASPVAGSWRDLFGKRHLGAIVVLAGGVALYATNIYLTASMLPTIVADIGGERFYAWSTTVFLVASVSSSVVVGKAVARFGARGSYVLALGFFVAGSVLCAVSPAMAVLLIGRAVQGIGGGLLSGLGYALIRSSLPEALWARASALISAMWGVGTLAGPALGGLFGQLRLWQVAFFALAAAGLGLAVLVPRALPRDRPEGAIMPAPMVSMLLLSAAVLLVSVAGVAEQTTLRIVFLVVAAVLVIGFVTRERGARARVLPRSTFHSGAPTKWIYLFIVVLAIGSTTEAFVPLFGQRLGGLAPIAAGFLGAALAAGWTIGEIPAANATRATAIRRILVAAPLLLGGGLAVLALTQQKDAGLGLIVVWIAGLLVAGSGIGIAWPHLATKAMSVEPGGVEADRASAAINTVQLVSNAFGSALAGLLVNLGGDADTGSARLMFGGMAVLVLLGVLVTRPLTRQR
ncbi:MFS transporter [Amycolatopsis sp. NPDC059021]|uniref:MFS transporter n=1 Tax=Amycolatopsis sp. NPDC059021 TaxID=3346704 RepID=UPI00366FDEE7